MEPSPSPSFCSFSRELSKSGRGGGGGIWANGNKKPNPKVKTHENEREEDVGSYDVTSIGLVLLEAVMQPDELFVLAHHRKVALGELAQCRLRAGGHSQQGSGKLGTESASKSRQRGLFPLDLTGPSM